MELGKLQSEILTWTAEDLRYVQGKIQVLVDVLHDVSKEADD